MEESQGLPVPAALPFPAKEKPAAEERRRTLDEAGRNSLNYASSLPDFLCTETVRRFEDMKLKEKQNWATERYPYPQAQLLRSHGRLQTGGRERQSHLSQL